MSFLPSMYMCDIVRGYEQKQKKKIDMIESYPIVVQYDVEHECYVAYLPDFGFLECGAIGHTRRKALKNLEVVKMQVISDYSEKGKKLPKPSPSPFGKLRMEV